MKSKEEKSTSEQTNDVYQTISTLYAQGYKTYLTGVIEKSDLITAEAVINLKSEHPDILLITIVTFTDNRINFGLDYINKYQRVIDHSDAIIGTSTEYFKEAFRKQNNYLSKHCNMVCHYDDNRGNSIYAYNPTKQKGLPIIDVFDRDNINSPLNTSAI